MSECVCVWVFVKCICNSSYLNVSIQNGFRLQFKMCAFVVNWHWLSVAALTSASFGYISAATKLLHMGLVRYRTAKDIPSTMVISYYLTKALIEPRIL